ncbi:hypothetical protein QAD02_021912 [Eretmocerus hayati]|uniref:Uncharacterized protein n=1 Tax=Eretmocerus hayati TaxID=131215 RepID=A0ACC2PSN7_9HYME|nr:hypothetical protein QAD02_021912 [Eretmocerus hayati]
MAAVLRDLSESDSDFEDGEEENPARDFEAEGRLLAQNLLPNKSRQIYELVYGKFLRWWHANGSPPITEHLLIVYFQELSEEYKPSTLWSRHSMLKTLLYLRHNIDINNFSVLKKFLTNYNKNYRPKKAAPSTWDQIEKFLTETDGHLYL